MTPNGDRLIDDLRRFVEVPSVSADPDRLPDVHASAALVADAFSDAGVDARVASASEGKPAVLGRIEGPAGAPTVLLYAHHDVQPVGAEKDWESDPFAVTQRDGRLYGRGTSDDKGGIAVHLETLRQFGSSLPVSVAILIEGEEEVGSPTLATLLEQHADLVEADVVLALDAVNAGARSPSITTSLRGLLNVILTVRTSDRAAHSGIYGGAVPDALGALVHVLASLTNADGDSAVHGLLSGTNGSAGPSPDAIRDETGLLDGVTLLGSGQLGRRLWHGPAITVTGIEAPNPRGAANTLSPVASASISLRLAPEENPDDALGFLKEHIARLVPWGAHVAVDVVASGRGWRADERSAVMAVASDSLEVGFGHPVSYMGVGGGIPFVASIVDALPAVDVVVTAIQDPASRAHAANESVAIEALSAATRSQVELFRRLAAAG